MGSGSHMPEPLSSTHSQTEARQYRDLEEGLEAQKAERLEAEDAERVARGEMPHNFICRF